MTPKQNLKDIIEGKTATELDAIVGYKPKNLKDYIKFLISPEAERMADGTRLTNLIVAVTELMEQKTIAEPNIETLMNSLCLEGKITEQHAQDIRETLAKALKPTPLASHEYVKSIASETKPTAEVSVEDMITGLEKLAHPSAEVLSDNARLTGFILAVAPLRQALHSHTTALKGRVVEELQNNSYMTNFGWKKTPEGYKSIQSPDVQKRIIDTDTAIDIITNIT